MTTQIEMNVATIWKKWWWEASNFLSLLNKKSAPENTIGFKWSDVQAEDEDDIAKITWLKANKNKLVWRVFK